MSLRAEITALVFPLAQHFLLPAAPMIHRCPPASLHRLFLHLLPCLALAVVAPCFFGGGPWHAACRTPISMPSWRATSPGTVDFHF